MLEWGWSHRACRAHASRDPCTAPAPYKAAPYVDLDSYTDQKRTSPLTAPDSLAERPPERPPAVRRGELSTGIGTAAAACLTRQRCIL